MRTPVRVRFAPSPTGPLHIGGVRTALYNYLFAKKYNGTFILRIEDTDQTRYVAGAEQYIIDSLVWFGIVPQEGPGFGGNYGPYRQSERKAMYKQYADQLLANGHAYYAFDTPEELDALRDNDVTFKYDGKSRLSLKNSLSLPPEETQRYLAAGEHIAVRLMIPENETITFTDEIRGSVSFESSELDDRVILKGDGMPTYHLANIIDDHLMEITHVIRGEEWLSSTPHHVLMYRFFGWEAPSFSHLPLILKPTGHGKLSKRDGAKFGFPVFPLSWSDADPSESFPGFKEEGYLPEAVLNFLAMLGWSPGDDKEMFSIDELVEAFSLEKIVKGGARFDIEKAKWYNQQYLIQSADDHIAQLVAPQVLSAGYVIDPAVLSRICGQMKGRVHKADEIIPNARFFFELPTQYDEDTIGKKFKAENGQHLLKIGQVIGFSASEDASEIEQVIKAYIAESGIKMGEIMPIIRIAVSGSMQGPDLMQTLSILGTKESARRIETAIPIFEKILTK
jgi:glutamyl-tRNA synthetase